MLRSLLLDLRPLETRAFRHWWLGSALSMFGTQLTSFALLYYVWVRTHDAALVGAVAVAEAVATIGAALFGGSLADRLDRHRVVLLTRSGQLASSLALAGIVVVPTRATIPLVFVLVAVSSGFGALGAPANRSFPALLLPPRHLAAGLALNRVAGQLSLLTGPLLAGAISAAWGVQVCFLIDAGTFAVALLSLLAVPALPPGDDGATGPRLRGIRGGVRLVVGSPVLLGAFATDIAATVLAMPVALFPVINDQEYGGSALTLGLFAPAIGLGGLVAATLSGRVTATARPGRLMLVSAAGWAAAIGCFGLGHVLWVGLGFLAIAGACDTVTVVSRTSIVQHAVPDSVRGGVNALDYLVGVSGPQLGNFRAGLVASATSGATSAALGGLASLAAIAGLAAALPALSQEPAHAPGSAEARQGRTRR